MASKEVEALTADSPWAAIQKAASPMERYAASRAALEPFMEARTGNPIPALFQDLPRSDDNSGARESILVNLIVADDIEAATNADEGRNVADIVDVPVEVSRIAWDESDIEGEGWGAYVKLEVSVDGAAPAYYSTSAQEVVTVLWRCWCEGRFPVSGIFRLRGRKKVGRDQPIGFQVESRLA